MREDKKVVERDATSGYRWCTADSDVAAVQVFVSVYIHSSTVSHLQMRVRDVPCAGCVGDFLRHHLE